MPLQRQPMVKFCIWHFKCVGFWLLAVDTLWPNYSPLFLFICSRRPLFNPKFAHLLKTTVSCLVPAHAVTPWALDQARYHMFGNWAPPFRYLRSFSRQLTTPISLHITEPLNDHCTVYTCSVCTYTTTTAESSPVLVLVCPTSNKMDDHCL